ncbi:hypothetical protein SAMN04488020_106120 [Palleronia marisminoris]|uniref:Uncharacterized protein n=1 Tax=Palleronia marisminoris TaxID=315423 RepID=A0A1Y5SZA3_9RHOB|nr:hypothetical protein [Palleronia marisminoris]SFH06756.1 hypothetical protein SAMN04488020_106120 [Palleronia marisminoris]SLN51535.1 hypothetical protein PAM7066_02353 [Palleronia marisminoris]
MDDVLIKCPVTGKPVKTGIVAEREGFEESVLEESTVPCPHCGQTHTWDKQDAWLAD